MITCYKLESRRKIKCTFSVFIPWPSTLLQNDFTVKPDACDLLEEEDVNDPLMNNEFRPLRRSSTRNSDYCDTRVNILWLRFYNTSYIYYKHIFGFNTSIRLPIWFSEHSLFVAWGASRMGYRNCSHKWRWSNFYLVRAVDIFIKVHV